jgi:hypothetical protein
MGRTGNSNKTARQRHPVGPQELIQMQQHDGKRLTAEVEHRIRAVLNIWSVFVFRHNKKLPYEYPWKTTLRSPCFNGLTRKWIRMKRVSTLTRQWIKRKESKNTTTRLVEEADANQYRRYLWRRGVEEGETVTIDNRSWSLFVIRLYYSKDGTTGICLSFLWPKFPTSQ